MIPESQTNSESTADMAARDRGDKRPLALPRLLNFDRRLAFATATALAVVIFVFDCFAHVAAALMVLYAVVIVIAAPFLSRKGTIILGCSLVAATLAGFLIGHLDHGHLDHDPLASLSRSAIGCLVIAVTTWHALRMRADQKKLTDQVAELKELHSALHASRAELAHAMRLTVLGEMAGSIAHEIRQPLSAITVNGEAGIRWLRRARPDVDEACASIEKMVSDARRANEIIDSVRALASKSHVQFGSLDINTVIREALGFLDEEFKRYNAVAEIELPREAISVEGDRIQLQQVIVNLVTNGLQAMASVTHRPRVVKINAMLSSAMDAVITVEDSGTGMDPERAARLFVPFVTTKENGLGLGLSICRSIAEAHRGSITCVKSSADGTRMLLRLPAKAAANQSRSRAATQAMPGSSVFSSSSNARYAHSTVAVEA
jgi:signal transduction histidine kinase